MKKLFLYGWLCAAMIAAPTLHTSHGLGFEAAQAEQKPQPVAEMNKFEAVRLSLDSDAKANFKNLYDPSFPLTSSYEPAALLWGIVAYTALTAGNVAVGASLDLFEAQDLAAATIGMGFAMPFYYAMIRTAGKAYQAIGKHYKQDQENKYWADKAATQASTALTGWVADFTEDYNILKNNQANLLYQFDGQNFYAGGMTLKELLRNKARRKYMHGYTLAHLAALRDDASTIRNIAKARGKLHTADENGHRPIDLALQAGSSQAFVELIAQIQLKKLKNPLLKLEAYIVKIIKEQTDAVASALDAFSNTYNIKAIKERARKISQHRRNTRSASRKNTNFATKNPEPLKAKVLEVATILSPDSTDAFDNYQHAVFTIVQGYGIGNFKFHDAVDTKVDSLGNSLLHIAAGAGNMKALQQLIVQGHDTALLKNKMGQSVFDILQTRIQGYNDVIAAVLTQPLRLSLATQQSLTSLQTELMDLQKTIETYINDVDSMYSTCQNLLKTP